MRTRKPLLDTAALLLGTICFLGAGGRALAAPGSTVEASSNQVSDNWAGYAVTAREPFRRVVGAWVQPYVSCKGGQHRYSAFWVGLGGFRSNARGLEQIGTEADCARGHATFYAWYELLPAGELTLKLAVHPGDQMSASVTVDGGQVALHLHDLSMGQSFGRTVRMDSPDISSAEWIAEAPSECARGAQHCQTLPLADFSRVSFSGTAAATRGAPMSAIDGPSFHATALTLRGNGAELGIRGRAVASTSTGQATPSLLSGSGSSFSVTWEAGATPQPGPTPVPPSFARQRR
jgi:hypothetical protein